MLKINIKVKWWMKKEEENNNKNSYPWNNCTRHSVEEPL